MIKSKAMHDFKDFNDLPALAEFEIVKEDINELFFSAILWLDQLDYAEFNSGENEYDEVISKLIDRIDELREILLETKDLYEVDRFTSLIYTIFLLPFLMIAFYGSEVLTHGIYSNESFRELYNTTKLNKITAASSRDEIIKATRTMANRINLFVPNKRASNLYYLIRAYHDFNYLFGSREALAALHKLRLHSLSLRGNLMVNSFFES